MEQKSSTAHPLAVAFKDTTNQYRAHMYETTVAKLDSTLAEHLSALDECNLVSTKTSEPDALPTKLTLAAKYDVAAQKLFQPIGEYNVTNRILNEQGELVATTCTLEEKLTVFEATYLTAVEEVDQLQEEWEKVVGEIWRVGKSCLGDDAMSILLAQPDASPTHSSQEPALLAPKQDNTPHETKKDIVKTPRSMLPDFMYAGDGDPAGGLPQLPQTGIDRLTDVINDLGAVQMAELEQIEQDKRRWWAEKQHKIQRVMEAE